MFPLSADSQLAKATFGLVQSTNHLGQFTLGVVIATGVLALVTVAATVASLIVTRAISIGDRRAEAEERRKDRRHDLLIRAHKALAMSRLDAVRLGFFRSDAEKSEQLRTTFASTTTEAASCLRAIGSKSLGASLTALNQATNKFLNASPSDAQQPLYDAYVTAAKAMQAVVEARLEELGE